MAINPDDILYGECINPSKNKCAYWFGYVYDDEFRYVYGRLSSSLNPDGWRSGFKKFQNRKLAQSALFKKWNEKTGLNGEYEALPVPNVVLKRLADEYPGIFQKGNKNNNPSTNPKPKPKPKSASMDEVIRLAAEKGLFSHTL